MLMRILHGTPNWVFVLFVGLIALGIQQSRTRLVGPARLAILPVAMLGFSLYGVAMAFGAAPAQLLAWGAGVGAAVLVSRALKPPAGVRWDAAASAFHVPGSWVPLALMMLVFFSRYAIAVSLAMVPGLAGNAAFATAASGAYGLMSGAFLARALRIWAQRPAPSAHSVQSI